MDVKALGSTLLAYFLSKPQITNTPLRKEASMCLLLPVYLLTSNPDLGKKRREHPTRGEKRKNFK